MSGRELYEFQQGQKMTFGILVVAATANWAWKYFKSETETEEDREKRLNKKVNDELIDKTEERLEKIKQHKRLVDKYEINWERILSKSEYVWGSFDTPYYQSLQMPPANAFVREVEEAIKNQIFSESEIARIAKDINALYSSSIENLDADEGSRAFSRSIIRMMTKLDDKALLCLIPLFMSPDLENYNSVYIEDEKVRTILSEAFKAEMKDRRAEAVVEVKPDIVTDGSLIKDYQKIMPFSSMVPILEHKQELEELIKRRWHRELDRVEAAQKNKLNDLRRTKAI